MSAKLHVHDETEHYEEELAKTPSPETHHKWMWITGTLVICIVFIGLIFTIINLAPLSKKQRSFRF